MKKEIYACDRCGRLFPDVEDGIGISGTIFVAGGAGGLIGPNTESDFCASCFIKAMPDKFKNHLYVALKRELEPIVKGGFSFDK